MACLHASSKVFYSAPKVGVLIGVDWELPQILSLAGCRQLGSTGETRFHWFLYMKSCHWLSVAGVVAWEMAVSHFPDAFPGAIQNIPLSEPSSNSCVWVHFNKEQNRVRVLGHSRLHVSAMNAQPCLMISIGWVVRLKQSLLLRSLPLAPSWRVQNLVPSQLYIHYSVDLHPSSHAPEVWLAPFFCFVNLISKMEYTCLSFKHHNR